MLVGECGLFRGCSVGNFEFDWLVNDELGWTAPPAPLGCELIGLGGSADVYGFGGSGGRDEGVWAKRERSEVDGVGGDDCEKDGAAAGSAAPGICEGGGGGGGRYRSMRSCAFKASDIEGRDCTDGADTSEGGGASPDVLRDSGGDAKPECAVDTEFAEDGAWLYGGGGHE